MSQKDKMTEKELLNACKILVVLNDGGELLHSEIKRRVGLTSQQTDHLMNFLNENLYVIPRTVPVGNKILAKYGISRHGMIFLQNTLIDPDLNKKIGFTLRGKELEETLNFLEHHPCKYRNNLKTGAIGGKISYRFTPTSIGVAVTVLCACGKEENVTDYDSW